MSSENTAAPQAPQTRTTQGALDRYFKITERGSTISAEIRGGLATFFAMSYIVVLNPLIIGLVKDANGHALGVPQVAAVTALIAGIMTIAMGIYAKQPFAMAAGLGVNALLATTILSTPNLTWPQIMGLVVWAGVLMTALVLTGFRTAVFNAVPESLKVAIVVGIGFFIAFIGMKSVGIVVHNDATLIALGQIGDNVPALLAIVGLLLMAVLTAHRVHGALLIGILAVTVLAAAFGITTLPETFVSTPPSIAPLFWKMDFSLVREPDFWVVVFTFFFVDFFDTVGTLVGVCSRSGLLDEEGRLPRAKGALMADAIGTVAGAILGTSTVTSYVESSSGVAQGGRTGLSSVVTAVLFIVAIFFTPIVGIVPGCATAPALILVGVYMMMSLRDLDYDEWTDVFPAILGFTMMPLTYSIATGIEFGVVSYVLVKSLSGKFRDVSGLMTFLAILFALKELLS